jgi:hypothetical protein
MNEKQVKFCFVVFFFTITTILKLNDKILHQVEKLKLK